MSVKLLIDYHLEILSFKGGCTGSSKSTLVKLLEISCGGSFIYHRKPIFFPREMRVKATYLLVPHLRGYWRRSPLVLQDVLVLQWKIIRNTVSTDIWAVTWAFQQCGMWPARTQTSLCIRADWSEHFLVA